MNMRPCSMGWSWAFATTYHMSARSLYARSLLLLLRHTWCLDSKGFPSKGGPRVPDTAACVLVPFYVDLGNQLLPGRPPAIGKTFVSVYQSVTNAG